MAPTESSVPYQPTRAGAGEYFHPTKYNKAALYGQFEFLRKVEELAPEVLVVLASVVRLHYEPLRREFSEHELLTLRSDTIRQRIADGQEKLVPLDAALNSWAREFHLNANWVRDIALNTLFHWSGGRIEIGASPGWAFIGGPSARPLSQQEMEFHFSDSGWDMTYSTKNDFIQKMRSGFEAYLAAYVKSAEQKAELGGWKRTPALRKKGKQSDVFRHVEWLVRWQVQEWEASRIANDYALGKQRAKRGINASAAPVTAAITTREGKVVRGKRQSGYKSVHDAITKAAELIELPLRRATASNSAS